jgi:hypothetical protein
MKFNTEDNGTVEREAPWQGGEEGRDRKADAKHPSPRNASILADLRKWQCLLDMVSHWYEHVYRIREMLILQLDLVR